jgi:predicted DNA-binding transcriptional regulator AlpA
LAALPGATIVYREELATALGCCEKSVTRIVKANQLPPPMVLGKRRAWLAGQIQKHLLSAAEKIEEDAARWNAKLRQHLPMRG